MQERRFAYTDPPDPLGDDLRVERLVATQRKKLVGRPRDTLACTRMYSRVSIERPAQVGLCALISSLSSHRYLTIW
jgi:hypothetical protein